MNGRVGIEEWCEGLPKESICICGGELESDIDERAAS